MSPRPELVALAAELRAHLARVRVVVERCQTLSKGGGDDTAVVWAVAGHLHSVYTGCEAILLRAARGFEGLPPGAHSHRALLDRACLDLPSRLGGDAILPGLEVRVGVHPSFPPDRDTAQRT